MTQNQNANITLTHKMGLVMAISSTMLLISLGVVHIHNSGIPVPTPVLVLIFAIAFITGTIFLEHRGGVFPWILLGGGIVGVIVDVLITCVFSGVVFIFTGKIFGVPWDILVYSLSACMILSVIALNITNSLDTVSEYIENRMLKEQAEDPEYDHMGLTETPEDYRV